MQVFLKTDNGKIDGPEGATSPRSMEVFALFSATNIGPLRGLENRDSVTNLDPQ